MPEETIDTPLQPPLEAGQITYEEVLAQNPDIHPDLRSHVERLAAATGSEQETLVTEITELGKTAIDEEVPDSAPETVIDIRSEHPETQQLTPEQRVAAAKTWITEHVVEETTNQADLFAFEDEKESKLQFADHETVPPAYASEVVGQLLDSDDYRLKTQLVGSLDRFSNLDEATADRLIENYPEEVLEHLDRFPTLAFNDHLADKLLASDRGYAVVEHIDDFSGITLDRAFADKLVASGNADAVIEAAGSFTGVELNAAFIDKALAVPENADAIAQSIAAFKGVEANEAMARRLIAAKGAESFAYSLGHFHDLSNETAEQILSAGSYTRFDVFKNMALFPELTLQQAAEVVVRTDNGKLWGAGELPAEVQSTIFAELVRAHGYTAEELSPFSSLSNDIAQELVSRGHIIDVFSAIDTFPDMKLDAAFARQLFDSTTDYPGLLLSRLDKFPPEIHTELAGLFIERGYADQLYYYVKDGKLHVDPSLASKLKAIDVDVQDSEDGGTRAYLQVFPATDHGVLAKRLLDVHSGENGAFSNYELKKIAAGLTSLSGLSPAIAEQLLRAGAQDLLAEHLSGFSQLDASVAETLIAAKQARYVLLSPTSFANFNLTAGRGLELLRAEDRFENFDLINLFEYMDPSKPPIYDSTLATKLIEAYKVPYLEKNIDLFENLDSSVADYLISNMRAGLALDKRDTFVGISAVELAKRAIAAGETYAVFSRLDSFTGLEAIEAGDNPNLKRFADLLKDKELTALLGNDGVLHVLSGQFLNLYMRTENPEATIGRIKALASGNTALWRINHEYAKLLIGEVGQVGYLGAYKVDAIPMALPVKSIDTLGVDIPRPTAYRELDADSRRLVLSQTYLESHPDLMTDTEISFTDLNADTQDTLLAYRLYESIATSRDGEAKLQASERNKAFAEAGDFWHKGDLAHATSTVANFRRILLSGVLCGETIGATTAADSYPFNVDTVVVSDEVLAAEDHFGRLQSLKNQGYGSIQLLFHRTPESTDYQKDMQGGMNEDHRLVFGAIPGTEISAVLLRRVDSQQAAEIIDAVIDAGTYIPVIDEAGTNILTYDQYQQRRVDGNYVSVHPRVLDSSFQQEGSQAGSNEGAMFVIPGSAGATTYYVKFGDASIQKQDHLWTEILADSLYRTVTPQLVPETEAVVVDGRLAKASKLISVADTAVTSAARNAGFIMDTYLGNWDAVYNTNNLVMSTGGQAVRVDTGNGLDFRARGDHKEPGSFGEVVTEIASGGQQTDLHSGMRQMYPELSDEEIRGQVIDLRDRLPDNMIDALVESVRRPKAERQELARILKARKQYLIDSFLGVGSN